VLLKPTVQMARIKNAKILERKLFIRRLGTLDVNNTFLIQGTAGTRCGW